MQPLPRVSSGSKGNSLALAIGAILIASTLLAGEPVMAAGEDACAITSRAGRNACTSEAADDYWIDIGICANFGDPGRVETCRKEAWATQQEALEECGDVFTARQQVCRTLGPAPYNPRIDPSQFVDPDDIGGSVAVNPYLPLKAGTRYVYRNQQAGEKVVVDVTHETIEIAGVRCRIVHDVGSDLESGEVGEDTDDFMAQDLQGNVWYFGEVSRSYEDGLLVSLGGSWRAGVDGAKPGILMKAAPQVGDTYRQEFMFGEAEDLAEVLNLHGSASSPYRSCSGTCLVTGEYNPLEPGELEKKYYVPGLGQILTVDPESGEREVLVDVSHF